MLSTVLSTVLIALTLSIDAFTVSVGAGVSVRDLNPFHALRAAFFFGFFQFFMPVTGWLLGENVRSYIEAYDHWVAFALLAFIGGKMVAEGILELRAGGSRGDGAERAGGSGALGKGRGYAGDVRNPGALFILSIATSIDALAYGVSLSILKQNVWVSAALIGGITFLVCLPGFEIGRRVRLELGFALEKWMKFAGGFILVGLGVKILAEHLL
jgi:putative Mn2+ efflux pump MntP